MLALLWLLVVCCVSRMSVLEHIPSSNSLRQRLPIAIPKRRNRRASLRRRLDGRASTASSSSSSSSARHDRAICVRLPCTASY